MPDKEFLESFPLYKKYYPDPMPKYYEDLGNININMMCDCCKSKQTFTLPSDKFKTGYMHGSKLPKTKIGGDNFSSELIRLEYICAHCSLFRRTFLIYFDTKEGLICKAGQYPPWSINITPQLEKVLGEHSDYYKKGNIIVLSKKIASGNFFWIPGFSKKCLINYKTIPK